MILPEVLRDNTLKQTILGALNKDRANWLLFRELMPFGNEIRNLILNDYNNFADKLSLSKANAIVSLAFGYGDYSLEPNTTYDPNVHSPGKSNIDIARTIMNSRFDKPIFAQLEVAEALKTFGKQSFFVADPRKSGKPYYSTQDVMEDMYEAGLTRASLPNADKLPLSICLVAHPHHLFRARLQFLKFFSEKNLNIEIISPDLSDVNYDPNSMQAWTRSREVFVDREVGVCIAYQLMERISLPL